MERDTLILCKALAELGEALKEDCPKNDCVVFRNTYEIYCELFADYRRIKDAVSGLSGGTIRAIEHAIRKSELQLYDMWANNYAIWKYRVAAGLISKDAPAPKPKTETVFEAVTKDAAALAGLLGGLPVIEAPWDTAFQKHYCASCGADNCDACPNEAFRNNPAWWLSLEAKAAGL